MDQESCSQETVHGARELYQATRRLSMDPESCTQRQGDCPWTQRAVLSDKETVRGPRELCSVIKRLSMNPDWPWTQTAVLSNKQTGHEPRNLYSATETLSMNPEISNLHPESCALRGPRGLCSSRTQRTVFFKDPENCAL